MMPQRLKWVADWRLMGDTLFGEYYLDDGEHSTGLIPARLVFDDLEYTDLGGVSPASLCVFDYKFNNPKNISEEGYAIHYIWAD